jgi:uncharacterized protein YfiM (DUF2279 family)
VLGTTVPGVDRPSFAGSAAALGAGTEMAAAKNVAMAKARNKMLPARE